MKFPNGCFGQKGISKKDISSPLDLFYNDSARYKNLMPNRLEREVKAINRLKPKIAEIKSLMELKTYLNIKGTDGLSEYNLKFIITKQRTLLLGEFLRFGQDYVTHAAIFNALGYSDSEEIIAAGRISAATNFRGNFEIFANNESGHFKPGRESVKHLNALIKRWGGYAAIDEDDR
ncbi:hypothetical protein F3J34_31940 [Klebsiella sp. Ap-873]|nr:hypothetical protein [Klebsiella sp. Ap-873]